MIVCTVRWAFAFASTLTPGLCRELARRLSTIGVQLDRDVLDLQLLPPVRDVQSGPSWKAQPRIVSDTRGMTVLFKPPGWEVDGPLSELGGHPLSEFLRAEFPSHSLPFLADFQYGFIHRLDVPSSGLILAGKTFEGLYSLRMQINTFSISREYLVLCDGVASASLIECRLPIDVVARRSLAVLPSSESSDSGRAALTWFRFLAHFRSECSLVSIRIHTGRNHQIRTHLLRAGHPTVVDGRYTCLSVMVQAKGLRNTRARWPVPSFTSWVGHESGARKISQPLGA